MQQTFDSPVKNRGWGIAASVSAHVALVALLVFGLPLPRLETASEEAAAIAVELVRQPDEEQAEAAQPEEPAPQAPERETAPPQAAAPAEQTEGRPLQALRPVFEFGEEDTGPRVSEEGNAAAEAETSSEQPSLDPDARIAAAEAVPEPQTELAEAKTLFSRRLTGDVAAMTAIGSLSRGERASELCATELREQLRNADPPYRPDLVPAYRLDAGTVLEVRRGAFRADLKWYDLRFRCTVDEQATRVVSFAFGVGAPVPPGEWKSRGFPDG